MNKCVLIGNLGKDPELASTQSGNTVCKFSLAVNRNFTDKNGERGVDFFNIVVWGKLAENCNRFLKKGRKAAVSGRIETRTYVQDGIKKLAFDIVADDVEFLSPQEATGAEETQQTTHAPQKKKMADLAPLEDEKLPF